MSFLHVIPYLSLKKLLKFFVALLFYRFVTYFAQTYFMLWRELSPSLATQSYFKSQFKHRLRLNPKRDIGHLYCKSIVTCIHPRFQDLRWSMHCGEYLHSRISVPVICALSNKSGVCSDTG